MKRIVIVDDSPEDRELTLSAFRAQRIANEIVTLGDGVEALDYLFCCGQYAGQNLELPA